MEESRRSRTYKKIPFTRELHKLQSHLSERSPEDTKVSFDKLKHLYRELMVACEHYEDSLLEIDDPDKFNELCSESDTYISEIHNKYCSVIDQANTFLESFSLLKESEPRSIKHDESTKPKAMIAEQSASDSTHDISQSVNKSASLDSNLTELIKLLQLPKVELQIFDGSPSKYYKFINQFKQSVENFTDDPLTRLNLLQQYCTGKAAKLISACSKSSSAEGYSEALDILEQRCGNPHVISEEIISSLRMGKAVRTARDLMELSDSLQEAYSTLLQLHKLNEVSSQSFFKDILNRIYIRSVKGKWRNLAADVLDKTNEYPYFPDFVDFIFKEAKHLNDPVYGLDVFKSDPVGTSYKKSYCSATSVSCPSCKEEHVLLKCPTFKRLSVDSRRAFVEAHNLCNLCLGGHADTCKSNYKCSKCKQRHSYLLHQESTRDLPVSVNLLNHNSSILPLVPVIVNGSYKTHALVDSGATDSFCTQRLLNYFAGKLDVIKARFPLDTVTGVCTKDKKVVKRLSLSSPSNGDTLQMYNLAVIDHIPVNNAKIDVSLYPHLQDIPGLCLGGDVNVDVLIGQDHSEALLPLDVVSGKKGKPFACKYLLGWAVSGSVNLPSVTPHKAISNFITSSHVPYRTSTSSKSPQSLDLLWNEELQDLNDSCLSVDDKFVLNLWDKETFLNEFSHYVIPIPFRSSSAIPDNRCIAEHRLNNLLKSLSRKNTYQRYDLEINKLMHSGYAEPTNLVSSGPTWYLPHHAVITDKKPDKVRVVYDCAAKYEGESLNDKCYQGPDLVNKLLHVLLRFREHSYAVCADVECMYYQVIIPPQQRDCLRFLWFDTLGQITTYRMTGHVFGGVWCASSSTYALRRTVHDDPFVDSLIKDAILNSFYVDDMLRSTPTVEELSLVIEGSKRQLAKGGFNLTKFITNEESTYEAIPMDDRAKESKIFENTITKTLGIRWNVNDDFFYFSCNFSSKNEILTRRNMLKMVASIYDPLGLINPLTVRGRILLQDATKNSLSWDEEVSSNICAKWTNWLLDLRSLDAISFRRCIKPKEFNNALFELHHFSDSSESAYGCVSYLRCVNPDGKIHTALILSKGRVTPIRTITIPRLELQAAVLAVKIDEVLRNQLTLSLNESTFWIDSNIVLQYINSDTGRFKTFVANRVSAIRSLTNTHQWRHINGDGNPADIITRGVSNLSSSREWFSGPSFLSLHRCYWPGSVIPGYQLNLDDPELKKSCVHATIALPENPVVKLAQYYSDWRRLCKAVAWLTLAKNFLLKRTVTCQLSASCLQDAEILIIKTFQNIYYESEVDSLGKGKYVKKSSHIIRLNPKLNSSGVLTVGGRIPGYSSLPIIPKGVLATLIVNWYHMKFHVGTEWLMSIIREKYWIIGCRSVIRHVKCFRCRKLFAKPMEQVMSPLPLDRVTPCEPPFSRVGIDCFGPFYAKFGRKYLKNYGCIFTCLVSRAVHIEVLDSLDTNSMINAYVRFKSRRGKPSKIISDNGSNLIGANNELRSAVNSWNVNKRLSSFFSLENVEWVFNPPKASNFGGAWESLIGVFRRVFTSMSLSKDLSHDSLVTLFTEIESIVNSRPITKVSDDVTDPKALTPNQILLLNSGSCKPLAVTSVNDFYHRRWKYVQHLADLFWKKWLKLYLPSLQVRHKWQTTTRDLRIGDLVLLLDESLPRSLWPMALVKEVKVGRDGRVRSSRVKTRSSEFIRPINKLVLLEGVD